MQRAPRQSWKWIRLAVLCICLPIGACNCNASGDAAEKDSKTVAKATTPTNGSDDQPATDESAESYPDDLYPDFNFAQFSDEERANFVSVSKAELCPCPDANTSLHECLQSRQTRCGLAEQSAAMIGSMVKASYNQTDILDKVAELVENAKQQHQFTLENRPLKGNRDAPVVIVEFADFECPYCKEASKLLDEAADKYGEKIAVYFKHYPLPAHQYAEPAARAAVAAHNQGKFWPMHDRLFDNQKSLSEEKIIKLAQRTGVNIGKFQQEMNSPEARKIVAQDRQEGEASGITGTPTLYINGRRYLGDLTRPALYSAIDQALRDAARAGNESGKE